MGVTAAIFPVIFLDYCALGVNVVIFPVIFLDYCALGVTVVIFPVLVLLPVFSDPRIYFCRLAILAQTGKGERSGVSK